MQRQHKTYIVYKPSMLPQPELVVMSNGDTRTYALTDSRYNQLVQIANSGRHHVQILDADYGVGWEMFRK